MASTLTVSLLLVAMVMPAIMAQNFAYPNQPGGYFPNQPGGYFPNQRLYNQGFPGGYQGNAGGFPGGNWQQGSQGGYLPGGLPVGGYPRVPRY